MLTLSYILRVARLRDQMGELRPGFLHDEKSNLRGPWETSELSSIGKVKKVSHNKRAASSRNAKYKLVNKVDPKSGDVRLVQKKTSKR